MVSAFERIGSGCLGCPAVLGSQRCGWRPTAILGALKRRGALIAQRSETALTLNDRRKKGAMDTKEASETHEPNVAQLAYPTSEIGKLSPNVESVLRRGSN
jgi:hypothetical protein